MIQIKHLSKQYNQGKENVFQALKDITLQIAERELVAFVGKSGAGKSTLMHIIACMDQFYEGEYILNGKSVRECSDKEIAEIRNATIGIVLQNFALMEDCTALDNVLLPMEIAGKPRRKERNLCALKILKEVDMDKFWDHEVSTMSGGEKQRVAIARALVNNPQIIIADEPTGALDSTNSQVILDLLKKLNKRGITVIIVTHDMQIARQCNRIIRMKDGELCQAD